MLLMRIAYLAQCCLIFWKKTSLLFNFFQKKTSWKIVAYKPLLIKQNECRSSKIKGETQHYVVTWLKSVGARHYCPKIPRVPGTHVNSSPEGSFKKRSVLRFSKLMSGSFHLSFFAFHQFWQLSYESQLSFSGKDSTADFFVFGHFDQNTKNENCNEPDIKHHYESNL